MTDPTRLHRIETPPDDLEIDIEPISLWMAVVCLMIWFAMIWAALVLLILYAAVLVIYTPIWIGQKVWGALK